MTSAYHPPYQNKFGEKTQNMSGVVTTADNIIVYNFFLIHICIHVPTLGTNLKEKVHPQ